jgi:hypothetical protein
VARGGLETSLWHAVRSRRPAVGHKSAVGEVVRAGHGQRRHDSRERTDGSRWRALTTEERLGIVACPTAELDDASVFVYPHALRHRNRALFAVLKLQSDEPLPENPHVTVARAALAFPEFKAPEFAAQPFERLELDLAR